MLRRDHFSNQLSDPQPFTRNMGKFVRVDIGILSSFLSLQGLFAILNLVNASFSQSATPQMMIASKRQLRAALSYTVRGHAKQGPGFLTWLQIPTEGFEVTTTHI